MNQITNKKFAAHVLLFDSQKWILKMIENCGPFVEKIYVAYSELPWTYNPNARDNLKNTADPSILLNSQYANKIELIHGVWERDEDQRNACLDRAKADGMDFLIIQDADEFYKHSDYSRMIEQIANNPDYDFYKTPWCIFWKSFDYILEGENGSTVISFPEVAINCKRNVKFTRARTPNSKNYFLLDALCYHGSFVSTDDEMYRKIHTWGHAHQFDRDMWYHSKWLTWTESTEDLHPVSPGVFRRAVRFKGNLPEVLINGNGAGKKHVFAANNKPENSNPMISDIYSTNPDTFRRWIKVGSLIKGENLSILDVGGDPNNDKIKLFIPHRITVVNPQYNNVSGTSLPFADESFDITMSIDTLEHVPNSERIKFVKELIRTAKSKVILACPFDEPYVSEMEKAIHAITKHPILEEHIRYGLPNIQRILELIGTMGLSYKVYNNDSLVGWASWILLHQTNRGRFDLRTVNHLLNQAYNLQEDHEISYRKVIEIFKDNPMSSICTVPSNTNSVGIGKKTKMVSIVIPTITRKYLDECIESIEKNTSYSNYEIILVNDGSSEPEFLDYLSKTKHRVLNLPKNVGFAKANNEGFKAARGDYIMTLNSDTLVHKDWLSIMVNTLESDENIVVVGPTVLYAGTSIIAAAGCFLDNNSYRKYSPFLNGKQIQDYPQTNTTYRVDAIGGDCMLFRRQALFDVGLFDENYINGWEDIDLCLSIRNKGYRIYHSPAIIEHYGGVARNKSPQYQEWVKNNRDYFYNKLKRQALDLFNTAEQFAQNNQYNDAIQYYMMAIEADPTLANAYYSLAIVYYNTSQKDAAIMSFNKVIELDPQNACAYNNLGVLYFSKGLLQEAEEYFKKTLSLDPNYEEAIQNLEKVHLKQSKFSVNSVKSPQQKQSSQLKINLIGALGNTWGAEYHVLNAFKELGHHVNQYDHRKGAASLAIGNDADISIVLKGDGIPPDVIKQLPKPTVLWYGELIHQDPSLADEVSKQKAKELTYNLNSFDIVFHHDYSALEMIKNLGAKNVFWLSNSGVNPKVHRKLNVPKLCDVGFTGTLSPRRIEMLNFLKQRGIGVKFLQVFGEELNLFINQCKIFINLHFSELLNTETRLHEILGAGTFALTEEISMPSMYIDNKHLVYWKLRDFKDLAEKILFYIQADEEREQIARTGHFMVHENYKYTDRCRELLAIVQANQNSQTNPSVSPNEDHLEQAFSKVEQYGGKFDGWALSKNAIRSFAMHVLKTNPEPNIIELGGGQSTLFWMFLAQTRNTRVKVSTFEHHPNWAKQLKRTAADCIAIDIHCYNLKQINDQEWNTIFTFPERAKNSWSYIGTPVSQSEFENTRIRNAFYDIPSQAFPPNASIDGMIVDGPHGNGRSLAFPLFFDCLKPNAWMLIDDFDHYPFLDDLAKIFRFKIVEKELANDGKRWVLLRLDGIPL